MKKGKSEIPKSLTTEISVIYDRHETRFVP